MKKVIHPTSLSFSFQDTIPSGNGYIMLDREFTNWPLFYDDAAWKLFTYLLMRANYTIRQWGTRDVQKGELITSYQHLADALHKSRDEVKRLLKKLKDIHEVETVRVNSALLIKMPNYLKYMGLMEKKKGKSARPSPEENPAPAPDESINKESKERNNVIRKENLYTPQHFSNNSNGGLHSIGSVFARQIKSVMPYHFDQLPPDEDEVRRYVTEKELTVDLDRFFDHYYSTSWCDQKGRRIDGWHFALSRLANYGEWL